MAIDQKNKPEVEKPKPLVFRDNPEVKKKIEAHKKANPADVVYYTRLVKEYPERAIETFLYRDVQKHENEMRLIQKQLPQAKTFYDAQSPEAKARIDRDLEGVNPYIKDKAFVQAALREKDRQARREFANPAAATTPMVPPPAAAPKIAA
jgi:hypothetical protein